MPSLVIRVGYEGGHIAEKYKTCVRINIYLSHLDENYKCPIHTLGHRR